MTSTARVTLAIVALAGAVACETSARVKPWRHAPDPIAEAEHHPGSPALADPETPPPHDRAQTLRIHLDSDPGRLHPLLTPSVWARRIVLGSVFESLIRYTPPERADGSAGRYEPRIAKSWKWVAPPWGGLELRIELDPAARFQDGHPLTSSDVQFTLDAIRDPRRGVDHLRPLLADVDKVELITPTEVRLVVRQANAWVLRALAEIPILPMHIFDGNFASGRLIGSGPWKLAGQRQGTVRLARWDGYWATKPAIANIEFVYQPDAVRALIDARHGELDIIPQLIRAHYPGQTTAPGITASFVPLELRPPRLRVLKFASHAAPVDDARVRHAIALLIDRNEIASQHFGHLARPVLWPVWPGGPVHGAEAPVPRWDPKQAGVLLDAAGWIDSDRDGIRDRAGQQLRVVMIGSERAAPSADQAAPGRRAPRDYLIETARRNGVVIELKTGSEAWLAKRIADGNYHLVELQWNGMVDSDISGLLATAIKPEPVAQPGAPPVPAKPALAVLDPGLAAALASLVAATEPEQRTSAAAALVSALAASWPIAGVVAESPQGLIHRRVLGARVWDGWIDLTKLSLAP